MDINKKNFAKIIISFAACFFFRLLPFRPPNVEPILTAAMPLSKAFGGVTGFTFSFFSIIFFDLVTGSYGVWSLITAATYGILGLGAFFFFRNRVSSAWNYAKFAIIGTLFFDAVTGLSVGPIFFRQSFMAALIGQIPFTFWHLVGNVSFAFILSPAIYQLMRYKEQSSSLETPPLINLRKTI